MESTGMSGRTQVSEQTALLLNQTGNYIIETRGEIDVKGKGRLTTYWLIGAAPTHKTISESYITTLLEDLSPLVELAADPHSSTTLFKRSPDSNSDVCNLKDRNRVLLLTTLSETHHSDTLLALSEMGYECKLSVQLQLDHEKAVRSVGGANPILSLQLQFDILLFDLDSLGGDMIILEETTKFRGPIVAMKSKKGANLESFANIESSLVLSKPINVEVFHKHVSEMLNKNGSPDEDLIA